MTNSVNPNTWTVKGHLISCDVDALWASLEKICVASETHFPKPLNAVSWKLTTMNDQTHEKGDISALSGIKSIVPSTGASLEVFLHHEEITENLGLSLLPQYFLQITIDRLRESMSVSIATVGKDNANKIWQAISSTFTLAAMELPECHRYLDTLVKKLFDNHGKYEKNIFLVMRFRDEPPFPEIVKTLNRVCEEHSLNLLRADDCEYTGDLWDNVMTYMYGCSAAIAVFDQVNYREFNPNVAIEVGFMMAMGKPVLLLKDQAIPAMPSDIVGKIYRPFNTYDPQVTIPPQVAKWIKDYQL